MSTQMQLARAPWGLGWRLAGGASAPPGVSPNSPVAPGAPDDGEPFDNPSSLKSRLGAAVQGLGAVLNPQGGGLESFLSGATGAYTGTQQNLTQAAQAPYERARADRVQGIGDALKGAQTDYYNSLAAKARSDANAAPDVPLHQGPNGEWGQFTTGPNGQMTFVPIGGQSGRVFRGPNGELLTEDPAHPGAMVPFTGVPTKRMPTPKATPAQTAYYNAIRERMGKINMLTGEPYTPDEVAAYGEGIARLVDPTFQRPTGGVPGSPTPQGAGYTSGNPFAPQP